MSTPSTKKPEQVALLEVAASEKPEGGASEGLRPLRLAEALPGVDTGAGAVAAAVRAGGAGRGAPACFFVDVRKALDFSPILKAYTQERGQPPTTR
ncbi:hypothetical protein ACN28S_07875 [Cystobacter fuscus]